MRCRFCNNQITINFVDLGSAPPSNAYLNKNKLDMPESWFPLRVVVCDKCWLVQTQDFAKVNELFSADYAYFSSFSSNWLEHASTYVEKMISRFQLDSDSHVVEVAANDGYLLQYVKKANIPCIGIEPTSSTAAAAREKGISIIEDFFGEQLANQLKEKGKDADLIIANNVLAHVPDINDFIAGFKQLLKPDGVATFEFPHLCNLIAEIQFDTIYHEHFSYLSLISVKEILESHGLKIFDVEELSTHCGSLRVFVQHMVSGTHEVASNVKTVLDLEINRGISTVEYYTNFQKKVDCIKNEFLSFLIQANKQDKIVCGYGAAAKGNTLLNYAGVRPDLVCQIMDLNQYKQGMFSPGSRIPIVSPDNINILKPDYIIIFPWNLKKEIIDQLSHVREWGCEFVTIIPKLEIAK